MRKSLLVVPFTMALISSTVLAHPMDRSANDAYSTHQADPNYSDHSSYEPSSTMSRQNVGRTVDSGYEPMEPDNIENHVTNRTKPYYKDMSMNDYNRRLKTAFRGQSSIQPEHGLR